MKQLKIKVLEKVYITFTANNISFIRGSQATKELAIAYTSGTGQTLAAGQILYSSGTAGQLGYLEVKSVSNNTLTGAGSFITSITHYPTSTEANKLVSFNIDGSAVNLSFYYNSNPVTNDIIVQTTNRTTYIFTSADFTANITDYDNDTIKDIMIVGDLTGFTYNNAPLVADMWITLTDIGNGALKYNPLNQDAYYEKDVQYQARDINNNISVN